LPALVKNNNLLAKEKIVAIIWSENESPGLFKSKNKIMSAATLIYRQTKIGL
jgi:hypothetical protein